MEFSLFNLMALKPSHGHPGGVYETTRKMVLLAEELGFQTAWFAEHHFSNHSICCSPLLMAAHFGALTKKIRLGPAVLILPFYEPLRLAEEIALTDLALNGRLELGFGTGYQPFEFERFGRSIDAKFEIFNESYRIVMEAITTGRVSFQGQHFAIPETRLAVSLNRPINRIFLVTQSPEILASVAALGFPVMPFFSPGRGTAQSSLAARNHINASLGRDDAAPVAVQRYIHVTESKSEAEQVGRYIQSLARRGVAMRKPLTPRDGLFIREEAEPDEPSIDALVSNAIIGPPDYVTQRILDEARLLNIGHLSCFLQMEDMPPEVAVRSLLRFGQEVMPKVQQSRGREIAAAA